MEHAARVRGLLGLVTAACLITAVAQPLSAFGEGAAPTTGVAVGAGSMPAVEPVAAPAELLAAPEPPAPVGLWDSEWTGYPPQAALALAGGGYAVAGWLEPYGEVDPVTRSRPLRLVVATREVDGSWTAPWVVAAEGGHDPVVATAGAGTGIIGWSTYDDTGGVVRKNVWASRLEEGAWTTPERVGTGLDPRVAMGSALTLVAWRDEAGFTRVRTTPTRGDASWSRPRSYAGGHGRIAAAVGEGGAAAVVWGTYTTTVDKLRILYQGQGEDAWQAPVSIPVRGYYMSGLAAAVDRAGRVLVAWTRGKHLYWTRRSLGGTWSKVAEISGEVGRMGEEYGGVWATVNGRGRALVVWDSEDRSFAARYRPRTGFTRAVDLSPDSQPRFRAAIGAPMFTGDGAALVLGRVPPGDDGNRFALRWQLSAAHPWSPVRSDGAPNSQPVVADSFGREAAALVRSEGRLYFHRIRLPRS